MTIRLSICICTYNRCASLRRTLETLAAQTGVNWGDIEVIVVENNCTDETDAVVAAAAGKLPIRRVSESALGLSHARNRAVREARGDWIIFTDDDVLLDEGWLAAYAEAFVRFPDASFAGGRVIPYWPAGQPAWFRNEHLKLLDGVLVWYELSADTRYLADGEPEPFGASFGLRRVLSQKIGPFRTDLGVRGKQMGRGEETEFLQRARAHGERGIYVSSALCRHITDPRRLTLHALYRHGIAKGMGHGAMTDARASGSISNAAIFLARGLLQLLKGRGDRFRQCVINAGMQQGRKRSGRQSQRAAGTSS